MPEAIPELIEDDELLARYVMQSNHIRKSDKTAKPDAFVPYPYSDASVTRHINIPEEKVWQHGENVAAAQKKTLYGRADFPAVSPRGVSLDVIANPTDDNPNHANVTGWPNDKPSQKIMAQEIAAEANYLTNPAG